MAQRISVHRDAEAVPALLGAVLRNRELLRPASFLVVPDLLRTTLGVAVHDQWVVYHLPVLLVSVAAMVPAIIVAEKYRHMKGVFVGAVAALVISQVMLYFGAGNLFALLMALVVFFSAFNVMEASLPSLISKVAPAEVKGTAMGVYSSLQFLGIFFGGIIGGMAHQRGGSAGVFRDMAARGGAHGAAELSDGETAAAWPKQGRGRWSRRPIAAGPRRGRSSNHRQRKRRLSEGRHQIFRPRRGGGFGRKIVSSGP